MENRAELIDMTAEIISAYVCNNAVEQNELPALISDIYATLSRLGDGEMNGIALPNAKPAINVDESVTDDFIFCLEDGRPFKSLKRHLKARFNLTPDEYRKKWGLPKDYPMVAPNYAQMRSDLAKQMGLGQKRKEVSPAKKKKRTKT